MPFCSSYLLIEEQILSVFQSCTVKCLNEKKKVKRAQPQCGNYGNSLSHFFGKNFVKAAVLLNKLLKS